MKLKNIAIDTYILNGWHINVKVANEFNMNENKEHCN